MKPEEITALRERLGWTQTRLAAELGVNFVTVNRWERGKATASPLAVKTLERLARRPKARPHDE